MATTREQIDKWFEDAKLNEATHLLIVMDGFDFVDYPVHVVYGQDPAQVAAEHNGKKMQQVMEIYDLSIDKDVQLEQTRAWNTGPAPERAA